MIGSWRARFGAPVLFLICASVPIAGAHEAPASGEPVVLAPGYAPLDFAAPQAGSYVLPAIGPAADAAVIDSRGKRGNLHELFARRVTLLSFIYTQCDDVNGCPLATFVMGQIARRLAADPRIGPRLRLVSYSFDLERDTPAQLERYAASFRPAQADWHFVTAPDAQQLSTTLDAYQQNITRSAGHAFAHILRLFLIDPERRIRNIYSTAFLHADTVAADIETVLLASGVLDSAATSPGYAPSGVSADADPGLGLPPLAHPPQPNEVALGERLFFDRRLSLNGTLSCAMCHIPGQAFAANELATAVGIEGRTVKRNAPTLLNVGWLERLFHDARENRLEQQVWGPLLATNEMANPSIGFVVDNLERLPGYGELFRAAYGAGPSMENIGRALAAYQRGLVAGGSAFDRWFYAKDTQALSRAAQRGFELFRGRAGCSACHLIGERHALFTDHGLHNTGLGYASSMAGRHGQRVSEVAPGKTITYELGAVAPSAEPPPNDLGRYEVTQDPADRWKYRTPTLRNVALTRPYMHDGSLSTLEQVLDFYAAGGIANEGLDPLIKPLDLNARERADVVEFLRSLSSPAVAGFAARAREVDIGNPGSDD